MPVVPHSQILRLHAAAVAVGLTTSRDQLLAGLPQGLVAAFPSAANASAQILSDLDRLNDLGQLPDGSVPLRTWLENALALHGLHTQAAVFREVEGQLQRLVVCALRDHAFEVDPGRIEPLRERIEPLRFGSLGRLARFLGAQRLGAFPLVAPLVCGRSQLRDGS